MPFSDSGFAGQETGDETQATFTLPNQLRTIRTDDGVTSFERQDVIVSLDFSDNAITIEIDGETFVMAANPDDQDEVVFEDATNFVALELFDEVIGASAFESFAVLDGELNESYLVLGFDTDPADIAVQEGTATYRGPVAVNLRRDAFFDAFGSGEIELVTNFDSNTIGGTATVSDDNLGNADFNFETITLTLENTPINANGFAGDISVQAGDINGELVSGGYEGRFFGEEAVSTGGNLYGRIDVDSSDTDTFVNGYFLGERSAD